MGSIHIVLLVAALAGCGGKLADAGADDDSSHEEETSLEGTAPAAPEDGEWGTWQLLWTGERGTRDYHPPFVELDLHPDGRAFLWGCASAGPPDGTRCPPRSRKPCLEGRITLAGIEWSVAFDGGSTGVVRDEPSGDIVVDGTGALPAKGHYRRVAAASREGCVPNR